MDHLVVMVLSGKPDRPDVVRISQTDGQWLPDGAR